MNKRITAVSDEFFLHLQHHDWKGNIRELKNVIERAIILSDGNELTLQHLPIELQAQNIEKTQSASTLDLASIERQHILRVLNYTKGNKTEAAKLLNIGLTTLYRKIEEYGLI